MKIFEYPLHIETPVLLAQDNYVFIDIETDGLSHKNKIAIIGLLFFTRKSPNGLLIQLFNDDYHSEKACFEHLFELIEEHSIDYFISFNGDSFDFPFMNARIIHYRMARTLNKKLNIDLMKICRKNKHHLGMEQMRLKDVEIFLGIHRDDTISGKDSVMLYQAYLENKDPKLCDIIMLHNYDDLVNMVPLLGIFDYIPESFDSLTFENRIVNGQKWFLHSHKHDLNHLELHFTSHISHSRFEKFNESIGCTFHQTGSDASIKLLLKSYPQLETTLIDTLSVLGVNFESLSSESKQRYVIAHKGAIYLNNIYNIAFSMLDKLLSD